MNNKGVTLTEILISAGVIIVLAVGGYFLYTNNPASPEVPQGPIGDIPEITMPAPDFEDVDEMMENMEDMTGGSDNKIQVIKMTARQWKFTPDVIEVNLGDTVQLSIKSVDVDHGIGIPDFGISTFLSPGETEEIEFVADKVGTYTFFCNVQCGPGHKGMSGTLIVK